MKVDENFLNTHEIISIEGPHIFYPLDLDIKEKKPIVKAILKDFGSESISATIGAVAGASIGGLSGVVIGALAGTVSSRAIKGVVTFVKDLQHPFKKYLNFNIRDFLISRGDKKDLNLKTGEIKLITQQFDYIGWGKGDVPQVDINDDRISRSVAYSLGRRIHEDLLTRPQMQKKYSELLEKDVLSFGMPLPDEAIFNAMKEQRFPFNSETGNPSLFFPDKPYKKWEIKVKEGYEDKVKNANKLPDDSFGYEPKWGDYNYGLITICAKDIIFKGGKGTYINAGGCNWQGTEAAGWYLMPNIRLKDLLSCIQDSRKKGKNIQVVIKTKLLGKKPMNAEIVDYVTF